MCWRITKGIYDKRHQEYYDKLQLLAIELEEHQKADFDYQTTVATVFSVARRAKEPTFTLRFPFNLVLELINSPLRGA